MNRGRRLMLVIFLMVTGLFIWRPAAAFDFSLDDLKKLKETAEKVQRATRDVPEDEEVEIGDAVAAQLLGAAPLVDSDDLQRYVNRVGMWVARQSERPGLPWAFGVIASENINAFATPGGRVLVTKGLFMHLASEAELAAVLGHEIAHVIEKHHLDALKKNTGMDLAGDVLQYATEGEGEREREALNALVNAGTQLYARGLDRSDEYEADRMGVVYATRAGYDPFALLSVLTTLDSINAESPRLALITKTHPAFGDRLQRLDLAIEGRLDRYSGQPRRVEALVAFQKKLIP